MKAVESSYKFAFSLLLIGVIVPIMAYFFSISFTTTRDQPLPIGTLGTFLETHVVEIGDTNSSDIPGKISSNSETSNKVDYSFFDTILSFPWENVLEKDAKQQRKSAENVLRKIVPAIVAEPLVEINQSCRPLIDYNAFNTSQVVQVCKKSAGNVFTGEVNGKPIKIGVVIMLGFEADVIEIRLRETYDFVDKIFIGESSNGHNMLIRKPLIWEYLAAQKRFQPFLPKIVRFIVDESNGLSDTWERYKDQIWKSENAQKSSLNAKLISWNTETKFFGDSDLVLVDHADDVIAARNLFKLRNCQIRPEVGVITNKQWFPWSRLDTCYNPPTCDALSAGGFNTWGHFTNVTSDRLRRTDGQHFVKGGIHMTDAPYAPFMFVKRHLACTECSSVFGPSGKPKRDIIAQQIREYRQTGDKLKFVTSLQKALIAQPERHIKSKKLIKLSDVKDRIFHAEVYHVPWFLKCNLQRYPGWVGETDPRIGVR